MEVRAMHYHLRYKARDFDFAQLLVSLRKRAGLTQEDVALQVGVGEKSIRNWEGGTNYPTALNLRKLIELYLDRRVFPPGQEQDEVRLLWEQLHERVPHRTGVFDEQWFADLLSRQQVRSSGHEQHPARRPLHTQLSSEAPDVSALYGRSDELAELERWLLRDRCRLVAVLGMGGIGKTALAVKLVQQVAPHFDYVLWRSLHNAPSLADVLSGWLWVLAQQHETNFPQQNEQALALLIKLLQQRRCLLVLDNLETL